MKPLFRRLVISMIESDERYTQRALELAQKGSGLVSPNPMVGAVLVNNGIIVGEGYHRYNDLLHAESYALEQAGDASIGATLYCNLEPCSHYGRTPPCTDALIDGNVKRVVVAIQDPDPRVSGRGFENLRAAGIQVDVGMCGEAALRLNESYLKYVTQGLPFVHVLIEHSDARLVADRKAHEAERSDIPWQPSEELSSVLTSYDAVVLGEGVAPPLTLVAACIKRNRHRPALIMGNRAAISAVRSAYNGDISDSSSGARLLDLDSKNVSEDEPEWTAKPGTALQENLEKMSKSGISSVAFLPGSLSISGLGVLDQIDKVTVLDPVSRYAASGKSFLRLRLAEETITRSGEVLEITGYPERS